MTHDDVLDLFGAEFLAAAVDIVLEAALEDVMVAIGDAHCAYEIAATEEAV